MPKSKTHIKRRLKRRNLLQVIMTAPLKIKVSKKKYLTAKGRKLLDAGTITKKDAWNRYGKYRYKLNPLAFTWTNILHSFK